MTFVNASKGGNDPVEGAKEMGALLQPLLSYSLSGRHNDTGNSPKREVLEGKMMDIRA